jgi:hypothetical protein
MVEPTDVGALVRLDRKVSKALGDGKGIRLTGPELELLAGIGMIEQLANSKAVALKEQARSRQEKAASINEARLGLTSSGGLPAGNSGRARALRAFG